MGIHLRIYKDSPNSTEFQGMNRTPFFDPKKGVPYQRLSPQSGSDGYDSQPTGPAVSANTNEFFIQMTQSIFGQGLNSGCNSQMLSNSTKTTVVISSYVKYTVVLTKLQVLR